MTGNFIKPPSMGEDTTTLSRVYEAVGLPPEYLTEEFMVAHVIPCVAATFSDGELVIKRPAEEDPVLREHFGITSFDQGTFGQRLRTLFEGDDLGMRHQVDGLIRFSANVVAHKAVDGSLPLPPHQM